MAKEFYSEVMKGGDVIRPETLTVNDDSITWKKRNKNLISTSEITINKSDIASVNHKNKLIGSDLSIKSKGGDDIDAKGFSTSDVKEIISMLNGGKVNESYDGSEVKVGNHYAVKVGEGYKKAKLTGIKEDGDQPEYSFILEENGVDFSISKDRMSDVRPYLDDTTWAFKHLKDYWYDDIVCISFYKANNKDFAYEITYSFGAPKKFKQGFNTYEECVAEAMKVAEGERDLLMNANPEVYQNVPKRATFLNDVTYLGESRQINEAEPATVPDNKEAEKAKREKEADKNKSDIEADRRQQEKEREKNRINAEKEKYKLQYDKQIADLKAKQLDVKAKINDAKDKELEKVEEKYANLKNAKQEERHAKIGNSTKEQVDSVKDQYERIFKQMDEQKKTERETVSHKYDLELGKVDKAYDEKQKGLQEWLDKKKAFLDGINPANAVKDVGKDVKDTAKDLAKEANPFA